MLSGILGESARAHGDSDVEMLPRTEEPPHRAGDRGDDGEKHAAPGANRSRDKIKCLDGLRGVACLLVFNYHFLWPWTPAIMMGYGALPPGAPEPYTSWSSWPILCLLTRGRPMVAIFFAISGYVVCRHILRAIHERRLDAAYQGLASGVFRRVFRLYIPPTISMFIVAICAQIGIFRSPEDIYEGPDSVYINGTVSTISGIGPHCARGTLPVASSADVASALNVPLTEYLGNATAYSNTLCLNMTSELFGPASLYSVIYELPGEPNNMTIAELRQAEAEAEPDTSIHQVYLQYNATLYEGAYDYKTGGTNVTNSTDLMWIQLGGSWEEHPFIHDNMTYAIQNFTRAYAEWANPFNFGHYHPRYDPHVFTIPIELRGAMVIYLFLLGTAALQPKWRLRFAGIFSAYSLTLGRWDMATFLGGTLMSELDIRRSSDPSKPPMLSSTRQQTAIRWFGIFIALYLLSYPDSAAEYTPGFGLLADMVPRYYIPLSGWCFYQPIGALLLLYCILRDRLLCELLETPTAQYLGKISFSFYLVHGPILHSLGFWIMPRLFERFGQPVSFVIGWVVLMSITLYLSNLWYRKIDVWSTTVGRRVEKMLVVE